MPAKLTRLHTVVRALQHQPRPNIFNALIVVAPIPLALHGVRYTPASAGVGCGDR
ncbi:hypothetical protein [Streptomyces sp. NBC_00203]|uniref:hypothetical protein n=1 Tax=Streptomyces sp. NBC_00203 TaxID=2975680 RepID=UPI003243A9B4